MTLLSDEPVDIDRRLAVAPMMDWTDCRRSRFSIKALDRSRMPCLLYVSSNATIFYRRRLEALESRRRGRGEPGVDRARRSNGFRLRRREATFPFSSIGADSPAAIGQAKFAEAARGRRRIDHDHYSGAARRARARCAGCARGTRQEL